MSKSKLNGLAEVALLLHRHVQLIERIVSSLEEAEHELEGLTERERVRVGAGFAKTKMHINGLLVRLEAELARRRAGRAKSAPARAKRPSQPATELQRIVALARQRQRAARDDPRPAVRALFLGPSRTGKTRAAQELAKGLRLEVHRIDLSTVVSKYIGETEKNLSRIFDEAAAGKWLLFFDEADALLGKRTDVRDAHDRYANIEMNYLLRRVESYAGVAVLACSNKDHIDPAILRRFDVVIAFPRRRRETPRPPRP